MVERREQGLTPDSERRRREIARLIRGQRIATQDHLVALLEERGWVVTQSTVSRDLKALGVRRANGSDGTSYELPEGPEAEDPRLAAIRELVDEVGHNGHLVVIRTRAGAAQAVARALDVHKISGVLGTIAGDDTVFVAPVSPRGTRTIVSTLRTLFR